MKKINLKIILQILFLFLYPLLLYIVTFIMENNNVYKTLYYIKNMFCSGSINYVIIAYLIILSIQLIIKSIMKENWKTNIITTTIVVIVTIISYYKQKILRIPFLPNDVLLIGNIDQITKFGVSFLPINIILLVIILILILLLEYLINKKYNSLKTENTLGMYCFRIIIFIIGILLLYNLCISPRRYIKFNIQNDIGNNYAWMGGNATFFIRLGDFYSISPEGYNKENIQKIEQEIINESAINTTEDLLKPNVVMIMSESFTNPNDLKNVQYSINPIKNIENLEKNDKNCIIGNTIVPVYGGGTSLPEFEALTGLTSYFLEKQIYPHTSYITNNMNSIVRLYNDNKYETIGIHTNTNTFYNRKKVYKYLGFNKTIFEEDIENPEVKGKYISDNELANQIIEKFEENEEKKYIFAVSMQNHMPYNNDVYNEYHVNITSDYLQANELKQLKNYVQGIYDADQMYLKLVQYFKKIKEPTILVMFGDHLPSLNSIYKKSNFVGIDYYKTPYVIWANYDIEFEKADFNKAITPSKLSLNITQLSNIQIPWYLKKFEQLYKEYPVINNKCVVTKTERVLDVNDIINYDLVNDCRILQYDLLIKKKYIPVE